MIKLEKILKAVANRRRLSIIKYLKAVREMPVGDIAKEIKLSFKATSKHLAVLDAVDILEKEQRSRQIYYRLVTSQHSFVKHILSII